MQESQTLHLLVQNFSEEGKFYNIAIHSEATVEELKCLIAIESAIEPERQTLSHS